MAHPILRHSCTCDILGRVGQTTLAAAEQPYFSKHSSRHATKSNKDCQGKKRQVFPFMKLPPEIRKVIYTMHFDQEQEPRDADTACPAGSACTYRVYNNWVPVRALLLVSRIVYNESMPLYYRSKTFGFISLERMTRFLDTIGVSQRSFITNISFIYYGEDTRRWSFKWEGETNAVIAFRALADCPALHTLHIGFDNMSQPPTERWNPNDLMTESGLDELLRLRGLTTVDVVVNRQKFFWYQNLEELRSALQVMKLPRDS